ncbi:serine/threonine-protein phosphatase 6 regulatory subunit 3-like [Histomonas meleagridis]|uniref:serine/threonine-protein phosphatase 6 regulatory subunit 3-like n=1 Tax=Histomonas meleagridis TaxID=135588 RepID=UPI00355A1C7F|nr:serine/threonine-protein phosphatase 6 regulatory subunit 3-like [Histomonas meleagridis]KAH0806244.1 serine/threonine-protein phosphatase 6 regulatory subunit 3-like [Histomonas meleagridis]
MFFWNYHSSNTINELLKKENVELTEILDESSLSSVLRNSNQELIDYFQKPEIIEQLFDWALTEKYKDCPKGQKYSRSSVTVFINSQPLMQQNFLQSDIFIGRLKRYIQGCDLEPFLVGNFQRIIETYTRLTNGTFLEKFPEIFDFLMKNISYLGIFELFIYLVTESPFKNSITEDLWQQYINLSNTESGYNIVISIQQAIKKCEDLKSIFQTDENLQSLLKTATTTNNKILATETFNLIEELFSSNLDNPIIHEYAANFKYQNDCTLSSAIRVFRDLKPEVIDFIFTFPISTFVIEAVETVFQSKTVEEQAKIVEENNILNRLIENSMKHRTEGRLVDFAEIISKIEGIPTTDVWKQFCQNELRNKLTKRNSSYGGSLPSRMGLYTDTDEDEDDDNDDDDEELADSDEFLDTQIDIPAFSSDDSLDHDYSDDEDHIGGSPKSETKDEEKPSVAIPLLDIQNKVDKTNLPPPLESPNLPNSTTEETKDSDSNDAQ